MVDTKMKIKNKNAILEIRDLLCKKYSLKDLFYKLPEPVQQTARKMLAFGWKRKVERNRGKFDIGVVGLWAGRNYGSMITYYALHQELVRMGLRVLMIRQPVLKNRNKSTMLPPAKFFRDFYEISTLYYYEEMGELNKICDAFIVGSDQLWNYFLSKTYGQYYFLDFVDDDKKKIAYGTSFGKMKYAGDEEYRLKSAANLQRFDAVSVRENFAVGMCERIYGVEAVQVADPVFFCTAQEYAQIEKPRNECMNEDYILAYILDPSKEKTDALRHVSERLNKKVKVILNEFPELFECNREKMQLQEGDPIEILENIEVRHWLYCIHHSQYVVTDSFHGTCFAIIFRKNFTSIINMGRGGKRFESLLRKLRLRSRLTPNAASVIGHPMIDKPIDYDKVFQCIQKETERSRKWLKNAIFSSEEGK